MNKSVAFGCAKITKTEVKTSVFVLLVEHRGFEPLTPTLPVLCAPNCANAPCSTGNIIAEIERLVNTLFNVFEVFCNEV